MVSARRLRSRILTKLGARIAPREAYVPTFHRSVDQAAHAANCQRWRDRGARIGRNVRLSLDLDHVNPHLITIGDNCVIGAGSVVTKAIPAGSVAAGNPARVIRPAADEEIGQFVRAMETGLFIGACDPKAKSA